MNMQVSIRGTKTRVPAARRLVDEITCFDLMLATRTRTPFHGEGWRADLKYDGFRSLAIKRMGQCQLLSRNGHDMSSSFPEVVEAFLAQEGNFVLDGELVVYDEQVGTSWERLSRRAVTRSPGSVRKARLRDPSTFVAFDVLAIGTADLRPASLEDRRVILTDLVEEMEGLALSIVIEADVASAYHAACDAGLEGIVAKRLASSYRAGRTQDWLKIKNPNYHRRAAVEGFGRR
ncbi:hypothetical protein [Cupriavidus sp. TMH.W2]|uniref:ATP-dependent DNA ligase n=1 Tax=Cupriavidus sp. TMH.W2 TaxID=3434465 RepID=UPI003D782AD5